MFVYYSLLVANTVLPLLNLNHVIANNLGRPSMSFQTAGAYNISKLICLSVCRVANRETDGHRVDAAGRRVTVVIF